ncbi:MAG: DUF1810 domain-containing protein [Gammaproteobacteria bacterium]|nr:DUF1810 domain-containing protein [Gammaproteobacteria bacterium]MBU1440356.1 DUF1810 domain-containing protein [Gammaproteobacteria bacterium]MBU2288225.1 DUF1810 domain-containing protein [Gammaproteobacteria bacterium]MBU2411163.1 DUF1810 domain-containing protein [Gammaproteobacteria bacterium]
MTSDLDRFVTAQAPVLEAVRRELAAGRKTSHWMWFVFPQLRGLGRSETARFYGIEDAAEALAYWRHPVLGQRLRECTLQLLDIDGRSAHEVFGSPDDLKLRSCMTLFDAVAPEEKAFAQVLERFYGGERDGATLALLGAAEGRDQTRADLRGP